MAKFKAIILAGGSGERFWPLSTSTRPKQFLDVFGGTSLIRQTFVRLKDFVRPADIFVVTSKELVKATQRELPELPARNVVGEPMRRDTGAAIALGTGLAKEGVLGFFPADQVAKDERAFHRALTKAYACAQAKNVVVTIGIQPTGPETGYGYVNPKTGRFVEKPDLKTAKSYLRKGYLWNAGMFVARAEVFRAAFAAYAPKLTRLAERAPLQLAAIYRKLPRISFDYAVAEKLSRVEVVRGNFGWDDVGSYSAFERHFKQNKDGNIVLGDVQIVESKGCTAVSKGAKIALLGVEDLVVVTTKEAVLVVAKNKVAELKKLFAK